MQVVRSSLLLLACLFFAASVLGTSDAHPVYALTKPCAFDPNNLIANGMMREGGLSQWGPVADRWNAFVLNGSPTFNWVDNEGIDPNGSQYIEGDAPFDAGIYQVVNNLQAGMYYHFWVGYALSAVDKSGGVNTRDNQVGRMVGVDVTGGTDPRAPNVMWGPEFTSGGPALNIAALDGVFAAQADHVTVYVRAINHSSEYKHKVWFDSICMETRPDLPTATPLVTATPTAAPTDTPRPTNPPARAVPATRVPTQTATDVPTATDTPTITNTPTPSLTPTDTPKPRRAIPTVGPGVADPGGTVPPSALLVGSVGMIGLSLIGILALGAVFVWRLVRRPTIPSYARPISSIQAFDEMQQFDEAIDPRVPPDEQLPGDVF